MLPYLVGSVAFALSDKFKKYYDSGILPIVSSTLTIAGSKPDRL